MVALALRGYLAYIILSKDVVRLISISRLDYASNKEWMTVMVSSSMTCQMCVVLADLGSDESYPGLHLPLLISRKRRGPYTEHNTTM
jgi:hypothetical protein